MYPLPIRIAVVCITVSLWYGNTALAFSLQAEPIPAALTSATSHETSGQGDKFNATITPLATVLPTAQLLRVAVKAEGVFIGLASPYVRSTAPEAEVNVRTEPVSTLRSGAWTPDVRERATLPDLDELEMLLQQWEKRIDQRQRE